MHPFLLHYPVLFSNVSSGGVPDWVLRGGTVPANLDIDFVNDRVWGGTSIAALLSCSRSSSGYYTNADGTLTNFPSNTLRYGTNGLLVEEQRINLCTYSQRFDVTSGGWNYNSASVTVTADQTAAPDGSLSADKVTATAGGSYHYLSRGITVVAGSVYTTSIYLKYLNNTHAFIACPNDANLTTVNLQTGVLGTVAAGVSSAAVDMLANGWIRLRFTFTAPSTSSQVSVGLAANQNAATISAAGTEAMYVWGAQLEAGSFATSYIPTTSGSATRNADNVTMAVPSYFNTSTGTFYNEALIFSNSTSLCYGISADDGTSNNQISIMMTDTGNSRGYVLSGGATQANIGGTMYPVNGAGKSALAWATNDAAHTFDGEAVGTDATVTVPTGLTTFRFGDRAVGGRSTNGYIRRVAYWTSRISNANLQTLTA